MNIFPHISPDTAKSVITELRNARFFSADEAEEARNFIHAWQKHLNEPHLPLVVHVKDARHFTLYIPGEPDETPASKAKAKRKSQAKTKTK